MSLTRWNPFRDMIALSNAVDQLFDETWGRVPVTQRSPYLGMGRMLAIDLYETDKDVIVKTAVPGVRPEDVDIKITADVLTIQGEEKEEQDVKKENYHLRERRYGRFSRSVALPVPVQADKAEAVFENGLLTLTLPKVEEVRPKTIKVKAKK